MTVHTKLRERAAATVDEVLSHRPVRAVIGAAVAPGVVLVALHLWGFPWDAYLLEMGLASLAVLGGAIGWYSMQDEPNIVKLDISGQLVRGAPAHDDSRCDIEDLADTLDGLQDAQENDDKPEQAVILEIDSPGGPVGASCELHEALDDFEGRSVAVVRDIGASGGYMAAAACDRILARRHSVVGSIGVIGSSMNYHDLLEDNGISYEGYTAGDHKDAGHPAAETDDQEREYRQGLVDAYMDDFIDRVTDGRPDLDEQDIRGLEGGVTLGPEAEEVGLIDALGDEDDAREWLADEFDVDDADDLDINTTRSFRPTTGRPAAERIAHAAGQGVASVLEDRLPDPDLTLEFRYRQ